MQVKQIYISFLYIICLHLHFIRYLFVFVIKLYADDWLHYILIMQLSVPIDSLHNGWKSIDICFPAMFNIGFPPRCATIILVLIRFIHGYESWFCFDVTRCFGEREEGEEEAQVLLCDLHLFSSRVHTESLCSQCCLLQRCEVRYFEWCIHIRWLPWESAWPGKWRIRGVGAWRLKMAGGL